jgi:hypothetical protein
LTKERGPYILTFPFTNQSQSPGKIGSETSKKWSWSEMSED